MLLFLKNYLNNNSCCSCYCFHYNYSSPNPNLNRFPVTVLIKKTIVQAHTDFACLLIKRICLRQQCKVGLCHESIDNTRANKHGLEANKQRGRQISLSILSLVLLFCLKRATFMEVIEKLLNIVNLVFGLFSKIMEFFTFDFLFKV